MAVTGTVAILAMSTFLVTYGTSSRSLLPKNGAVVRTIYPTPALRGPTAHATISPARCASKRVNVG